MRRKFHYQRGVKHKKCNDKRSNTYFGIQTWTVPEKDTMVLTIQLHDIRACGVLNTAKKYDTLIRDIHHSLHKKGYITSMSKEERTQIY